VKGEGKGNPESPQVLLNGATGPPFVPSAERVRNKRRKKRNRDNITNQSSDLTCVTEKRGGKRARCRIQESSFQGPRKKDSNPGYEKKGKKGYSQPIRGTGL